MIADSMSLYVAIGTRVPITAGEVSAFSAELAIKRALTMGAEGETYQKIIDEISLVEFDASVANGFISTLTGMTNDVQTQLNGLLTSGFAPQNVFEKPPTDIQT